MPHGVGVEAVGPSHAEHERARVIHASDAEARMHAEQILRRPREFDRPRAVMLEEAKDITHVYEC